MKTSKHLFCRVSKIKIILEGKKYLNPIVPLLGLKEPFLLAGYSYILKFALFISKTITAHFKIS